MTPSLHSSSTEQQPCQPSNTTSPAPIWSFSAFLSCRFLSFQSTWDLSCLHPFLISVYRFSFACFCHMIQYAINLRWWKSTKITFLFSRTTVLGISFGVAFLILSVILLICFIGHFLVSKSMHLKVWFFTFSKCLIRDVCSLLGAYLVNYVGYCRPTEFSAFKRDQLF